MDALWTDDDFAVLLGLKRSIYPDRNLSEGQELERYDRLKLYIRRNQQGTEEQQDVVWSPFCALYLPATVNRLLDLPTPTDATTPDEQQLVLDFPTSNPWHEILVCIQHIPYLAKYLRSTTPIAAPGKRLP
ncbi:hypothetical protein B0H19DRAFT_227597 [Mycena capillaripes]|nr:hypothetical protein B0H19DRAFT_227597 [Mycena capillaripes]